MASENSISVTAPALVLNGQTIASGINFDMGLPNLTDLINQSLSFVQSGNSGNQQFLSSTITQAEGAAGSYIGDSLPVYTNIANAASSNAQAAIAAENAANARASSGGGLCFITTAVCEREGLADDCDDLQTLRAFRDGFMSRTPRLRQMVAVYYAVAPIIVERLNALPDYTRAVTYMILREFISSCVTCIECGDDDGAFFLYCEMLEYAAGVIKCS